MSQQRRERQKEKSGNNESGTNWGRIALYGVVIVAAFGLSYYFGYHRSQHKYDAFARCLGDRGAKMYGLYWCEHCADQKKKFGASFEFVPYVECGVKGDTRAKTQVCKDAGVERFPTWQFPPTGERVERVLSLEQLSDRTGCSLP